MTKCWDVDAYRSKSNSLCSKKTKQNCLGCITCATTENWPLEGLQWEQGSLAHQQTWCHQRPFWSKSWQWWQVLNLMGQSPLDCSKWALSQFERNIQDKPKKCFLKLQAIKPQKPNLLFCCSFSVFFPPAAAVVAKSLQLLPTLCDPTDSSPPGSTVPGILQARTLEWVAISSSNAWKWKVKVKSLSRVRLVSTPWTAAHQAPPSMDFPGKSTGVGCHCLLRFSPFCPPKKCI